MQPEPLPPPTADLAQSMVGVWRLLSREDYDRSGRRLIDPVLGADPVGLLVFSATRFALQLSRRDRASADAGAPAAAPAQAPARAGANNSAAANGYDAYFGSHTVDAGAGLVTTLLEGSIVPSNVGKTFTRDIRVAAGRLYIRLETNTPDGIPITRTLTFERD
jgi:hypothetical protein